MPRRIRGRLRGGGFSFGGCWKNAVGVAARMRLRDRQTDLSENGRFWWIVHVSIVEILVDSGYLNLGDFGR